MGANIVLSANCIECKRYESCQVPNVQAQLNNILELANIATGNTYDRLASNGIISPTGKSTYVAWLISNLQYKVDACSGARDANDVHNNEGYRDNMKRLIEVIERVSK